MSFRGVHVALRLALACLALGASGCAVLMNGFSDKVKAKSETPGAKIYVDGFDATTKPIVVPNDRSHIVLVRANGYHDKLVVVTPTVQAAPIVLDIVLAAPSILIAPLTDIAIGWWRAIDSPKAPINLEQEVRTVTRARPVYWGTKTPATPEKK